MELLTDAELTETMTAVFRHAYMVYDLAHQAYEAMDLDIANTYAQMFDASVKAWRKLIFAPVQEDARRITLGEVLEAADYATLTVLRDGTWHPI